MKRKIVALVIVLCVSLTGCSRKITNEYGKKVSTFGPYIEISHIDGGKVTVYTVYREDTKVVYEIVTSVYWLNIQELHSYDEEGHPILQFYEDGEIITKSPNKYSL